MMKNLILYRVSSEAPVQLDAERFAAFPFTPCMPSQSMSAGWLPPRGEENGAMVEHVASQVLLKYGVETKVVPTDAVARIVKARSKVIEDQTGRRPKGKAMKELKEEVSRELLPNAFPKQANALVWIDFAAGLMAVETTNAARADRIAADLVAAVPGLTVSMLQTKLSPAGVLSAWLGVEDADTGGFQIERACELRATDTSGAVVRYKRLDLETDEVRRHVANGMRPAQVELSYGGRIAFTLTDTLRLRGVQLLDVVLTSTRASDETLAAGFDTDVALFAGEVGPMLQELIELMGGLLETDLFHKPPPVAGVPGDGDAPDELLEQARTLVVGQNRASISFVQRHLQIGYNRAARLMEAMEREGTVSAMDARGNRNVLKVAA